MPKTPLQTQRQTIGWVTAGAIGIAILLVLTVGVSLGGIGRLYDAQEQLLHGQSVLLGLERVISTAKDAETGQRGFLLTGREEYLQPYRAAVATLESELTALDELNRDDPAQASRVRELRSILGEKLAELADTIKLRQQQGNLDAALQLVLTNQGKATMDRARAKVLEVRDAELRRQRARETERAQTRRDTIVTTSAVGLIGLLMCIGFAVLMRRHLSAQAEAANAIVTQQELLHATLVSIGDAVITTDDKGNVALLNDVAQSLTGWTREEAVGKPLPTVFHIVNESTREGVDNPALRALREGKVTGLANHTILIARDGRETPIDDSAAPIRNSRGSVVGAVLVFRDITERKRAEAVVRDGERRKDEFLATLAHELRNPLAPLRNAILLARSARTGAVNTGIRSEELLAMMERQVEQMVRLVDDLLDVARITRGRIELRVEKVDVGGIVRNALETCAPVLKEGDHAVSVSLPQPAAYVDGDATRLSQVVCNLLNNAAKYSEDGEGIALQIARSGTDLLLEVVDHGIGIPQDMTERVFDMFSQVDRSLERSKSGLGIGLTLARQIVEMHGGTIRAESGGPGLGSKFIVRLPEAAPPAAEAPVAQASPVLAPARERLRILIADDNRDSADSMGMLLRAFGDDVLTVYNGTDAVELANSTHPDVILLDIGMPGMDGYRVAAALRSQPWASASLLIALTGWGQPEYKRRSHEAGFDDHLVKPVFPEALEAVIVAGRRRIAGKTASGPAALHPRIDRDNYQGSSGE